MKVSTKSHPGRDEYSETVEDEPGEKPGCEIADSIFDDDQSSKKEVKDILECEQCDYKSEWDFALRHHQEHHRITPKSLQMFDCMEEPKKYECNSCDYITTLSIQLMNHIQTEHQTKALPLINLVVYSDTDVEIPEPKRKSKKKKAKEKALAEQLAIKEERGEECVELKCFNCDFMKFSEMFLVKHMGPKCSPKFIKLEQFSSEENQGVSDSIKKVIKLHNVLGSSVTVYQFKCLHCFKEHDENLQAMAMLKDMEVFKCYHCSYETTKKMYLKEHIRNRHSLPENIVWLECPHKDKCQFKCKNKDQLKRHLAFTHSEIRNFPCTQCPYRAKYKRHLDGHVLNIHTDLRPYPCEHCSYKAKSKLTLTCHMRSFHTDEADVEWHYCELCPFKGRCKNSVKLHVNNRHTAPELSKKHPCPYCKYKAKRSTHLKMHMDKLHLEKQMIIRVRRRIKDEEVDEKPTAKKLSKKTAAAKKSRARSSTKKQTVKNPEAMEEESDEKVGARTGRKSLKGGAGKKSFPATKSETPVKKEKGRENSRSRTRK